MVELPGIRIFLFSALTAVGGTSEDVWNVGEAGRFDPTHKGYLVDNGRVNVDLDDPDSLCPVGLRVLGRPENSVREIVLRYRVPEQDIYWLYITWHPGASGREQFEVLFNGECVRISHLMNGSENPNQETEECIALAHGEGENEIRLHHLSGDGLRFVNILLATHETLTAPGHWIEGHVLNRMGEPLKGVDVQALTPLEGFWSSFSSPTGHDPIPGDKFKTKTDQFGHFRLVGLPEEFDKIGLRLNISGWHVNDENYPVDQWCRITMDRPDRVIKGRVLNIESGEPVREFTVTVYGKSKTFSDPGGAFTIGGLWPYRYRRLFVDAEGYQRKIVREIAAGPEETAPVHEIRIRKGGGLEGLLVDRQTGKGLPGVEILHGLPKDYASYDWADSSTYDHNTGPIRGIQRRATGEEGTFEFLEAADERGILFIIHEGYARLILRPEERRTVPNTTVVQVELEQEASLTGLVTKDGEPRAGAVMSIWKRPDPPQQNPKEEFEEVVTDSQGGFRFSCLSAGTYKAYVNHAEFSEVVLSSGEDLALGEINLGETEHQEP